MYSVEEKVSPNSIYFFHTPTADAKSMLLYPTAIGSFNYLPGYSLTRNRYDSYLIIFVESGTMEILLDGKYQAAKKGDSVILNCYNPHAYQTNEGCKTLWIHFDGKMAKNYYTFITKEYGNIISSGRFDNIRSILLNLIDSFKDHSLINEIQLSLNINNLLLELITDRNNENEPLQNGIKRVTSYLADNFRKDISLNEMADMAGFSPYYFTRKFKKETGMTPHQFLLSTRICAAKYNLSNTSMTISEIAYSCGFDDESAFCYCFRKREGLTPNEFRTGAYRRYDF